MDCDFERSLNIFCWNNKILCIENLANYYFDLKREDFQDWIELNCKFYNFYSGIEFESDAVYSIKLNLHWIFFFLLFIFICWRKWYTFIYCRIQILYWFKSHLKLLIRILDKYFLYIFFRNTQLMEIYRCISDMIIPRTQYFSSIVNISYYLFLFGHFNFYLKFSVSLFLWAIKDLVNSKSPPTNLYI